MKDDNSYFSQKTEKWMLKMKDLGALLLAAGEPSTSWDSWRSTITRMGLIKGQSLLGKESSRVLYSTVSVFGELKGKIRAGCFAEVAFVANRCGHKRQ